jgi:hypothetical protein
VQSPYCSGVTTDGRREVRDWLVPFVSTLVGAAIALFGSWLTTTVQVDAQTELARSQVAAQEKMSRDEYLRDERTAAYAKVLNEDDRLANLELTIDQKSGEVGPKLRIWAQRKVRRLQAQENALDDAVVSVEMFGTPEAVDATKRLVTSHGPLLETLYDALAYIQRSDKTGEYFNPSFVLINEAHESRQRFIQEIRDDLGVGGSP